MSEGGRERILDRIRDANRDRTPVPHPGDLPGEVEPPVPFAGAGRADCVDAFEDRFRGSGGEVVRLIDETAAITWLADFVLPFESAAVCLGVPDSLQPSVVHVPPAKAALGVSMAVGAAAQTGSILLSSREGRRSQLLPPVHIVWLRTTNVVPTLAEALEVHRTDLPAVLALHSGPSKSADIGRIIVTGVHGPGRLIAAIIG